MHTMHTAALQCARPVVAAGVVDPAAHSRRVLLAPSPVVVRQGIMLLLEAVGQAADSLARQKRRLRID